MEQQTALKMALSIQQAEAGIDYDTKAGAVCPWCGERLRVVDTRPWCGNSRIRYQRCVNPRCPMHVTDRIIKTVQSV